LVESLAGDRPVCRPRFGPGDALLFDQFFVHRSDVRRHLPGTRYAVESWFFAPSAAPADQAVLVASTREVGRNGDAVPSSASRS
jgi:hypothetical protein